MGENHLTIDAELLKKVNGSLQDVDSALETTPTDVTVVMELQTKANDEKNELEKQAKTMLREKRESEKEWNELRSSYAAAEGRYRSFPEASGYQSRFHAHEQEINRLMGRGDYRSAKQELIKGQLLLREMRRAQDRYTPRQQSRPPMATSSGRGKGLNLKRGSKSSGASLRTKTGSGGRPNGGGIKLGSSSRSRGGGAKLGSTSRSRGGGAKLGSRGGGRRRR